MTYTVEYALAPTMSGHPIPVLTHVKSHTVMLPGTFGLPITVTNAPTLLNTNVTACSTVTQTMVRTYVVVTSDYMGSTLSRYTAFDPNAPSDAIVTVIIFAPRRYVILQSFYDGTAPSPSKKSATGVGQIGTVVVF